MTELTEKQKVEKLRDLIDRGTALLQEAAQYAGENNIPLKYIDDNYEGPEPGEEVDEDEEDDYRESENGPLYFGGQYFSLEGYGNPKRYYWNNSNC